VTTRRRGLAARLFGAQVLVVVTGMVTVALVAAVVGPPIFHDHLVRAGHASAEFSMHVEEGYASANAISLGVALVAALAAATAASAYLARKVAAPMAALAGAATEVADGHFGARVPSGGFGAEFDTVAEAFNAMAGRLQAVEESRRRMLADLAHEMRTPLATIGAYLEAVEDGITVDDEDSLRVLRDQTGRLRRLADDIGAVSRAEEQQLDLRPLPMAPQALVSAAVATARARYAAGGVTLDERVDPHLPAVLVDADRLGQLLGNLLDNALRHTPAGGRVDVAALAAGDAVEFVVTDTGEGIAAEHLPHLFERFYRVDRARDRAHGGSGIGLAIASALARAHAGDLRAASDGPGRGATFTLRLPTSSGAGRPAASGRPVTSASPSASRTARR
jgi:signal transduction histidine kinase